MIISKADKIQMRIIKMSLVVQWLRVHASTVGGMVLFPGWGAKILQGHMPCDEAKKKKKKKNYVKLLILGIPKHGCISRTI